jgi:hypothetical protein
MARDYAELVNHVVTLSQYDGYLDTAGRAERNTAQGAYNTALRTFVYHLLKEGHSANEASRLVEADLDEIAIRSNDHVQPVYDELRADLLAQIARDGRKKGWQRTLRYYAPAIVGLIIVTAYFGVRLYSALPVDKPLDTREGMIQRAVVIEKMARFDAWAYHGIRPTSEAFSELLRWPIKPNEDELKASYQLIALIGERYAILAQAKQACLETNPLGAGNPGDQRAEMLGKVAAYLRSPGAAWQKPIANTIDAPIKAAYPCHEIDYDQLRDTLQDLRNQTQPAPAPAQ